MRSGEDGAGWAASEWTREKNECTLSLLCPMDEVGEMDRGSAVKAGVDDRTLASTYDCSFECPYGEFLGGMGTVSRASFLDTAERERRRWIGTARGHSGV